MDTKNWLPFLAFVVVGFLLTNFLAGKKEGDTGIAPPLILHLGSLNIHFHHWIFGLFFLGVFFSFGYNNLILHGILVGIVLQGLTYNDFYQIFSWSKNIEYGLYGLTYHIRKHSRTHAFKKLEFFEFVH